MKPNPDQQKELDQIFVVHTLRTSEGTRSYKVFLDKQAKSALNRYIERVVREGRTDELEITIANMVTPMMYEPYQTYKKRRLAQLKSEDSV